MEPGGGGTEKTGDVSAELAATLAAAIAGDRRAQDVLADEVRREDDGRLLDAVARAAADGSPIALDLLLAVVDESPRTRAPIRRLLVDTDAVDDVVQDVLIAVAERVGSFRGDARFTTWLHQIARNKTIDHLRRQRDASSLDDDDRELSDGERMSSLIASRTTIRVALDELPDRYRDAVMWRDLDRMTYEEIATRAGIPTNTAKTHVARGRALLAGSLGRSN